MVEFAQELIDEIVDKIARTDSWYDRRDQTTLRACALAARTFLAPSQRHLFRSLTLSLVTLGATRFTEHPHLASYVRDLHIQIDDTHTFMIGLAALLPLINRVERLAIRYWKWDKAPIDLRTALAGLMSLPSLRCLGLSLCDVPASLIRHALASYQEVVLEHVNLSNDDQFSALAISPPFQPTLHHLVLDDSREDNALHSLVLSDQIAPSLANLQHLGLGVLAGGSLGVLEQLARKCSGSIQHLVINLGSMSLITLSTGRANAYAEQHHDPISLPDMPSLRFLTFKTSPKQLWVSYSVFSATVNLPTCMPHIEAMNIVIDAYPEHLPNDSHRSDVDGALENLGRLRKAHFTVVCNAGSWLFERFEEDIRKKLPRASDAGILGFSLQPWLAKYHAMADFAH
ncbi:hypothetical protein B0H13DRAFT_1872768 [Mycena leptocephala]|nr:hypothetical protein B0H13DRAFT_1872768 [Mycena leptocephala]